MHTPKLSELSEQDKIRIAAELDGWHLGQNLVGDEVWICGDIMRFEHRLPGYSTSYDAIIPLVQNQDFVTKTCVVGHTFKATGCCLDATPAQLLDSLLVATGKATT